ncbi:MAG: pyridoxamine 5'-phosphate oxidase family protein [Sedimentisphaerales bacterium]|nr:pyridoxamine 5'-phosphate oxidase family protein [Sedimentisphaerales bacterium]
MMTKDRDLTQKLSTLLRGQMLGVLSTCGRRQPYASLVAFAATDDLLHIVFVTSRRTRKYANLTANAKIAMLIDNRSGRASDFRKAMVATAVGTVREIRKIRNSRLIRTYLNKHPGLYDFVWSPTCSVLDIQVELYYIVERFQQVTSLRMNSS